MRTNLSLNGTWRLAESFASCSDPAALTPDLFKASVAVPGLARFANPRPVGLTVAEQGWSAIDSRHGVWRDPHRDYFWYRRSFVVDAIAPAARLRFAKAQFGIRVWLNGQDLGERHTCFSSAVFDAATALRPGENDLLVRVGAHPGMLPPSVPTGSDQEKFIWTAGLYDEVALWLSPAPIIDSVRLVPLWRDRAFAVEWTLHNPTAASVAAAPVARLHHRGEAIDCAPPVEHPALTLLPGASATFTSRLCPFAPRDWSPADPFLYELSLAAGPAADSCRERAGLREFRFDTVTRRAWLNGAMIYLRGTNIGLHRFFEDEACENRPWDEAWVRRLLLELPRRYHWNCMRWTIGPAPERWLEIADEAGLLIEYEFFIWRWRDHWDHAVVRDHAAAWLADARNHPSVAWWSLSNETRHAPLVNMVGELRALDPEARHWSNGYNLPEGEDDPVDDHPYILHGINPWSTVSPATPATYELSAAPKTNNAPHPSAHAVVFNEYCWAWLRRDDAVTDLTAGIYGRQCAGSTPAQRRRFYADLLAAETEYLRAHRNATGVLHFTYLTCDHPWSLTGDIFADIGSLRVQADHDLTFMHCFNPLGVYLNFWQTRVAPGGIFQLDAMLINDESARCAGEFEFALHAADPRGAAAPIDAVGATVATVRQPFSVGPLGQLTLRTTALRLPDRAGDYVLTGTAYSRDGKAVTSRRRFTVAAPTPLLFGAGA